MTKTILSLLGVGTALVLWKTADDWLPKVKAFIENDIKPPTFRGIKNASFDGGKLNFTAIMSFANNSPIPVSVDRLTAKVFRLINGQWKLIGETRPQDQQTINLPAKKESSFEVPLSVGIRDAVKNVFSSVFNLRKDQFRADIEGRAVGIPFSVRHQFTDAEIISSFGLLRIAS